MCSTQCDCRGFASLRDSNADAQAAACRSVGRVVATGNVLSSVNIRSNRPHTFQQTQPHLSQSQCLAHPIKVRVKSQPGSSSVSFRLVPGAYGGGDDGRKEKTANAGKFALSQWFESLIARRFSCLSVLFFEPHSRAFTVGIGEEEIACKKKSKCRIKNELNYLQINAIVSGTESHVIDSGNLSNMIYVRCWRKKNIENERRSKERCHLE